MVKEQTRPRRIDRTMPDDAKIEAFLHRIPYGFLAMSVDDRPYVAPKLFWFDKNTRRIYFHSAKQGRTRESILANPYVCFSAAELGNVLPARSVCDVGVEYASVCIFGNARLVDNDEEKLRGLRGLIAKFVPDQHADVNDADFEPAELERTNVYAIEIEAWSGKQRVSLK